MTAGTADWVGQLIDKRYQVSKLLGEGGMGFVYAANDTRLGAKVVLKVPRPEMLADAEFRQRFVDEVRALVKLSHPNIVKVTDFGNYRETPFAVLQFLPGGSLDDRRPRDAQNRIKAVAAGSLPSWLPAVADALDYIHAQGYIHRDIKPGNILFDAEKHAFISDFGVAKAAGGKQTQRQQNLTGVGNIIGTPEYLAPEVVLGQPFDGRIDQYALAITVYELLSGRVPFQGGAATATLVMQTRDTAPRLDAVRPNVSPALATAVERAMAKDPAARFPNCTAFARACIDGLAGKGGDAAATPRVAGTVRETLGEIQSTLATPPSTRRGVPPRQKSRRGLVLGLAFGGLVLIGGIATAVALAMKGDKRPEPHAQTFKAAVPVPPPGVPAKPIPPPKPAPPPGVTAIHLPRGGLTLTSGGRPMSANVVVARDGTEPVTLTFTAQPPLTVSSQTVTLAPGETSTTIAVAAAAVERDGLHTVAVTGKTPSQSSGVRATLRVAVRAATFGIAVASGERPIKAGTAQQIPVTIDRTGGYDGPVKLTVGPSATVDAATAVVPAGQKGGTIAVAVKDNAPTGPATVSLMAEASTGGPARAANLRVRVVALRQQQAFLNGGPVSALAIDADGKKLLVGLANGWVKCWTLDRPGQPDWWQPTRHTGRVTSVAFSQDGRLAVSGGEDNTVNVYKVADGSAACKPLRYEHKGGVWHVFFARKGSPLPKVRKKQRVEDAPPDTPVSVSPDAIVYWDVKTAKALEVDWKDNILNPGREHRVFLNSVEGMAPNAEARVEFGDGVKLAGLGGDTLEVSLNAQRRVDVPGHGGAIKAFAASDGAARVVTVGGDGQLRAWDIASGGAKPVPLVFPFRPEPATTAVAVTPDGTRMAIGDADGTVRLYQLP